MQDTIKWQSRILWTMHSKLFKMVSMNLELNGFLIGSDFRVQWSWVWSPLNTPLTYDMTARNIHLVAAPIGTRRNLYLRFIGLTLCLLGILSDSIFLKDVRLLHFVIQELLCQFDLISKHTSGSIGHIRKLQRKNLTSVLRWLEEQ